MQWRRRSLLAGMLALPGWQLAAQTAQPTAAPTPVQAAARVVSLGGSVTEVVYALGAGDRLVAVDISSLYPEAAHALPKVGYYRDVSVEGIASLRPDVVLASDQAGPPAALARLRGLGVAVQVVPDTPSMQALRERITRIARVLSLPQAGQALVARMDAELAALPELPAAGTWPSALSIMAHGSNIMAAGAGTAADAVLQLSGVRNVLAAQKGYRPVSIEAVAARAPDLIITTELSVRAQGGQARFLALPMLAPLQAAREKRLVVMDDLMYLTVGPRLAQAVTTLREQCARVLQLA